jgi:hypothetical protein
MDLFGINPSEIFGGGGEQATKPEGESEGGLLSGIPVVGDVVDLADDAGLFKAAGSIGGNMLFPGAGVFLGPVAEQIGNEL